MKTKYFKVTMTKYYYLDYADKQCEQKDLSMVNGWPSELVEQDWFDDINKRHAARDAHEIGNATFIQRIDLVDEIEEDQYDEKNS